MSSKTFIKTFSNGSKKEFRRKNKGRKPSGLGKLEKFRLYEEDNRRLEIMKNDVKTNIEIEQFIRDYLVHHHSADRLDAQFHNEFSEKFGGKRTIYPFGACPNHLAMKWLKRLYDEGTLKRYSVGLQYHETGFPNWVYCYELARTPNKACT